MPGVGADEDFFALGGTSLLAIQIAARSAEAFAVEISPASLFEAPTIAKFAGVLAAADRNAPPAPAARRRRRERGERHRPSRLQEEIWIGCVLDPSARPHLGDAFLLTGSLDADAFERALNEVVGRHESLRTVFPISGYRPGARVLEPGSVELARVDLTSTRRAAREAELQRYVHEMRIQAFDFRDRPPFRVALVKLSPSRNVFVIVLHELICDGVSFEVLTRELAALYSAAVDDSPSDLHERPATQYFDAAHGMGLDRNFQLDYWRRRAKAPPVTLSHPFDAGGFPLEVEDDASESVTLSEDLVARLRALGESESATAAMVYLAVYFVLFHRCAYGADLVIDIPIAGRSSVAFEEVVGYFARRIPLYVAVRGEQSFRAVLRAVRELMLEVVENSERIPYPELMSEIDGVRGLRNCPVAFRHYGGARDRPLQFEGLTVERILSQQDEGHLAMVVSERRQTTVRLESETLGRKTVGTLLARYRRLLDGVAENPDERVCDLDPLSPAERRELLAEAAGAGEEEPEHCVHELVELQAQRTPGAFALRSRDTRVTYGDLDDRADRLARALRARGVGSGSRIGVAIAPSVELVVAMLGIWRAHATCVLGAERERGERAAGREALALDALVVEGSSPPIAANGGAGLPVVGVEDALARHRDSLAQAGDPLAERVRDPAALDGAAFVIWSAGVTGSAKRVVVTHRTLARIALWTRCVQRLVEGDRAFHQDGPGALTWALAPWPHLVAGAEVICPDGGDSEHGAQRIIAWLRECEATIASLPAELAAGLLSGAEATVPSLRSVIAHGRGALPRASGVEVLRQYSIAEAGGAALLAPVEHDEAGDVVGRPLTSRLGARILDADLALVPPGEVGELHLSGVGLAEGYLDADAQMDAIFVPDPFAEDPAARMVKTGDLARRRPDGSVELLGRIHDEVHFRGFRLNPKLDRLESALRSNPAVSAAATRWDEETESLLAYIVPRHRDPPNARDLNHWVKRTMTGWLLPARYVAVAEIPRRADGSPDRRALAAAPGRAIEAGEDRGSAQERAEQKLASIWKQVLDRRRVEREENFFRCGGDLIRAVEMVTRAEQAGLPVTIANLIDGPTIAELAATLEDVR